MSFFSNANNTVISAYNLTMTAYSGPQASDEDEKIRRKEEKIRQGFEIIYRNTTRSALDGSTASDPAKDLGCLHGTRLGVRDYIVNWLNSPDGKVAMWMYGPAGIGKTAIAQMIAQLCEEQQRLSSTFFFFRSDKGRNSTENLVMTLTYGLLQQMPHTHDLVCTTVGKDPLISSAPLERQIKTIILPALSTPLPLVQITERRTMLLIVDGLDECVDPRTQISVIRLFVSSLAITSTAIRHKILIVSRPESQIVSAFDANDIAPHVHHLSLDEWKSIADIAIYLRAKLEAVKQTHPLKSHLAARWPSELSFKRLLNKSFESFAYATSAIRYISSHDRHPDISLNNLLCLAPPQACEAYAELDLLYRHVLASLDAKTLHIVLKVLCMLSFLNVSKVDMICRIIGEETFSVELALIKMTSVIRLKKQKVSYYHTSFSEFLQAKERSGDLYLYSPRVGTAVAEALISRFWNHPATFGGDDHNLIGSILRHFNNIPVDMQINILETFLVTSLPTSLVTINPFIGDFFKLMERNSRSDSKHLPTALLLLFRRAFEHLTVWLSSLVVASADAGAGTLEVIFNTCFKPSMQFWTFLPTTPGHILSNLVRKSDDPWCTIRRVLPAYDSQEICIPLLNMYLNMSRYQHLADLTRRRFKQTYSYGNLSLTSILIGALLSEPADAQICHLLEHIILKAISKFPGQMDTQSLIALSLSQDASDPASVWPLNDHFCPIAKAMDIYICKTHAKLNLEYISDDVRGLYYKLEGRGALRARLEKAHAEI